ncbi:uncharacterized protein SCHCODRAFT_02700181 [Schizophyllum commune H4-8]|uniref:uncharacterized protein n=1 Tax=Schizophyllum commune (strain H4-8 / FGSC 9210) TaxID=578458 RepID=UPI002160DE14|nr:uncharacterized protein SCHCODRAFT_02700181 [Schizophyllum commune H4-8]KAI5893569.1 hypothetical protein SCHCODRAFT_02700181 [Schizophyllum commune H4-8]
MSFGNYKVFSDELRRIFLQGKLKLPMYQSLSTVRSPSWQKFVRSLDVPEYRGRPALMWDKIRDQGRAEAQLNRLFCKGRHTLLQNVSGSGKTSILMEGLRHHWGLYFVGVVDYSGIGSNDVPHLAEIARTYLLHDEEARLEMLKIPLLIRLLAFELYVETIDMTRVTQEDRESWLLAQACGLQFFRTADEYRRFSSNAYWNRIDVNKEIDSAITRIQTLTNDADFHLYGVIDKAQALALNLLPTHPGDPSTSIHREIARSWEQYPWLTLIISGDTFPYSQYHHVETDTLHTPQRRVRQNYGHPIGSFLLGDSQWGLRQLAHAYRKPPPDSCDCLSYHLTSITGSSDGAQVSEFLSHFLPPSLAAKTNGQRLMQRASAWLHGRHCFSAAFVQFFLDHGPNAPHTLLDHYIARMTGFRPVDSTALVRREKRIADYAERAISPLRAVNKETSFFARGTLHHILYQYLTTASCDKVFGSRDCIELVESGAGRFRDDNASQIVVDEPLSLISAAQWFCESEDAADSGSFFSKDLIYSDHPQISSARDHAAFLLACALNVPRKLSKLFNNLDTPASLNAKTAELVEFHRTLDATVRYRPFRYGDLSSSHPSIIATDCTTYEDVLAWLRHEHTSPVCFLPDQTSLLFALRLSDGSFVWVIAQTSSSLSSYFPHYFLPPSSNEIWPTCTPTSMTDDSEATTLLSDIPAPCTLLRSPPIIAVAFSSPERPPPKDRTTWNRTLFDRVEAAVSQRDILLRLVANIVQLDAAPASDLLDPLDKDSHLLGPTSKSALKLRSKRERQLRTKDSGDS